VTDWQSTVSGNSGPTHGGSGHQFNGPTTYYYVDTDGDRLRRDGRDPRATARDHLVRLNKQFVEPPGYGKAWALLEDHGCVILTGPPGIGMRAAGQMLLYRLGGPDGIVQDLSCTPDTSDEEILDVSSVTEGDLRLLDTSEAEEEQLLRVLRKLPPYQAIVRERAAHLVVVVPADRDHLVRPELRPLIAPIQRPPGIDVVRRHLVVAGIPFTEEQLRSAEALRSRLTSDPMRELAELVRLIGTARASLGTVKGFDGWLAAALDVLGELGNEVAKQAKEQRTGPQRALLLATAMLVGAPADQVHHAAAELLVATSQPGDERPALERDDLAQRLTDLKIVVDATGHVRFAKFGYDVAVRQHFWTNFPELRPQLRRWAGQVAVSAAVEAPHRGEFVSHFSDQALRTNRPDDIVALVDAWVRPGSVRSRSLPAAALALERGLGHQRHGGRFRRLVYEWSRDTGLDVGTAYLAIALSADVIASTHPSEAVVRLHHFVRRQAHDVREAAEEALLRLVRRDARQFRRLLDRVVQSLTTARWSADYDLFLVLARPEELVPPHGRALIAEAGVREQLVAGWRAVLFERQSTFWAALARQWLSTVENGRFPDWWLEVLVSACAGRGVGAGRLYVVARDWAREPDTDRQARGRIALDLINRMDRAQGITPAADPRHRSEEPTR
jgi:hypothetical protein